MKFTDPIFHVPKKIPPSKSWWADASAQVDRVKFAQLAQDEHDRIVGNERFGGSKQTHNKMEPK